MASCSMRRPLDTLLPRNYNDCIMPSHFTTSALKSIKSQSATQHLACTTVILIDNLDDILLPPIPIVVTLNEELEELRTNIKRILALDYDPFLTAVWSSRLLGMEQQRVITPKTLWPWLRFLELRAGNSVLRVSRVDMTLPGFYPAE